MPKRKITSKQTTLSSEAGTFLYLLLLLLCLLFVGLLTPSFIALIDPRPPISETMVHSLQRGQLFFMVGAALFLILTAFVWKSSRWRRFFTSNATVNVFLMIGALLSFAAAEVALRPMM
jgi:xanthine/uracil permease